MILINIYAWALVVLQSMFPEYESAWGTQEVVLMWYFIFELVLSVLVMKPPRYKVLMKLSFYIDIIIITPIFLLAVFEVENVKMLGFFRVLRIFKIFRVVRLIEFLRKLGPAKSSLEINYRTPTVSPLTKQILILVVSLFSALFIGAGIMTFIDDECDDTAFTFNINYVDAIYYMVVTGSTLGYGDIYPTMVASRVAVIWCIVVIIYIFGSQVTRIISLMNSVDNYDVTVYHEGHIVIYLFNDNLEVLISFLLCYFRYEDKTKIKYKNSFMQRKRKILIVSNREKGIDREIKEFINLRVFEGRIKYISSKGNVDRRLIAKARLDKAKTIFFLWDPTSDFGSNQDKLSIIYSHFLKNHGVAADIYIQSTIEHNDFRNWEELDVGARRFSFKSSLSNSESSADSLNKKSIQNNVDIICTQKMIMQLMARNVFSEGFIQFISCMLVDKIESSDAETYCAYIVKFPKNLIGIQFDEAWFIYNRINQVQDFKNNEFRFLLFGIVKKMIDTEETTDQIIISPMKHIISETDFALILWNKEEMVPIFEK